jgi:hypothetical protein
MAERVGKHALEFRTRINRYKGVGIYTRGVIDCIFDRVKIDVDAWSHLPSETGNMVLSVPRAISPVIIDPSSFNKSSKQTWRTPSRQGETVCDIQRVGQERVMI